MSFLNVPFSFLSPATEIFQHFFYVYYTGTDTTV